MYVQVAFLSCCLGSWTGGRNGDLGESGEEVDEQGKAGRHSESSIARSLASYPTHIQHAADVETEQHLN